MEDAAVKEAEVSSAAEFVPALVAAHPIGHPVAVVVGPELRVFDLQAISFGAAAGKLFTSAGDDKLVKVWKTDLWRCIRTITKAVAFSLDGLYVAFEDKFGVVWLVTVGEDGEGQVSADKPVSIFGQYCSIITSMVASCPKNPMKGATEIQSFCLGHIELVSCIAFTRISGGSSFILSGGGDSTVRLWDHINGCLLDTYEVKDRVGEFSEPNETEDSNLAIADICLAYDDCLVAVAVQRLG